MEEPTLEQRVAQTILEQPIGTLKVDGREYAIPAPTTATLIMVSALISRLPELDPEMAEEDLIPTILRKAQECEVLGQIAATFVLGAKRINEHPMLTITRQYRERRWSWRHLRKVDRTKTSVTEVSETAYLAEEIPQSMTPKQLHEFLTRMLAESSLADFFVLTTSLRTKSLLAKTQTEVVDPTAPGLS